MFDPLGHPLEGVSEPLGICPMSFPKGCRERLARTLAPPSPPPNHRLEKSH
jgi:hypothetical protein